MFSSYLEFPTVDEVQKPSNSESYCSHKSVNELWADVPIENASESLLLAVNVRSATITSDEQSDILQKPAAL
jgi:hypothetical protein